LILYFLLQKIKQISLGQAHTLVLCYEKYGNLNTSLYIFGKLNYAFIPKSISNKIVFKTGSNHYGQLGIGQSLEDLEQNPAMSSERKKNLVKCSIPLRLNFDENIRLIHTKYFTNFAVTDSNRLFTWGLSPPELRIINQTKKRAKASQKLKDVIKNDVVEEPKAETVSEEAANQSVEPEKVQNNEIEVATDKNVPTIKIDECKTPAIIEDALPSIVEEKDEKEDPFSNMEEYTGHLFPSEVDTFEVDGDIIYLSSGIYHNALITTKSSLFVWG
jgi:alpha-tubulin suppressor-like RCC1 family protein